jgi:hypothetical protein
MFADLTLGVLFASAKHHDVIWLITQLSLKLGTVLHDSKDVFRSHSNKSNAFSLNVGCSAMPQVCSKTILQ